MCIEIMNHVIYTKDYKDYRYELRLSYIEAMLKDATSFTIDGGENRIAGCK